MYLCAEIHEFNHPINTMECVFLPCWVHKRVILYSMSSGIVRQNRSNVHAKFELTGAVVDIQNTRSSGTLSCGLHICAFLLP